MTDFSEQRNCIKLCYELGKSATETLIVLRSIYGKNALCRSKTFHWYSRFRDGQVPSSGKPGTGISSDLLSSSSTTTGKTGKKSTNRRKSRNTHDNSYNFDVSIIEAQLNYVKMLIKLGKSPSETYTCLQSLFGPNVLSRIDLLQLYCKLEADLNLSPEPSDVKPPKKLKSSSPYALSTSTAQPSPEDLFSGRQTQSRVDLMTGGSFWHVPYNEKENSNLTENQVCFMDHFMLSGDSNKSNGFKITIPQVEEFFNGSNDCDRGATIQQVTSPYLSRDDTLPLPVESLNRMHVMDGDCTKSDIVAEKAPELQLPPPASTAEVAANGHADDAEEDVKPGLKGAAIKKASDAEDAVKDEDMVEGGTEVEEKVKTNGNVSDDGCHEEKPVVNGDSTVSDKCKDDVGDSETSANLVNGVDKVQEKSAEDMSVDQEDEPAPHEIPSENGLLKDEPIPEASASEDVVPDLQDEHPKPKEDVDKKDDNQDEEERREEVSSRKDSQSAKDEISTACSEDEERTSVSSSQNRKRRLADPDVDGDICENEAEVEGDGEGEGSSSDSESGTKRQRVEVEVEDERERLVREYVERCTQSVEEMSRNADKLQREIGALGELARAKELEWNSILRLRKLKEEMLERLLRRRRQTMMLADNGLSQDWANDFSKSKSNKNSNNQLMMVPIVSSSPGNSTPSIQTGMNRSILSPDTTRLARLQRPILPKPTPNQNHSLLDQQNTVIGEGRQGPILDVKSIIADYRSRHPDNVPRRGRRMKMTPSMVSSTRITGSPALMSMANMALCSGAHIRNNSQDCITGQENSRPSSADSSRSTNLQTETSLPAPGLNFKDVLVQFAKMSQPPAVTSLVPSVKQTQPPPPPPYPEVTLHPVPAPTHSPSPPASHSSSLLHGILTKSAAVTSASATPTIAHRPTTFSPTLARLLTAPERERAAPPPSQFRPPVSRVSISDLLTTSKKTRNEITITPVSSHSTQPKSKDGVVLLEDDPEETDSTDRLVIDESADKDRDTGSGDANNDDVPECQGCNQRAAQFVCAGCGNQWYCSRECQVTAWEEHSEMCSG